MYNMEARISCFLIDLADLVIWFGIRVHGTKQHKGQKVGNVVQAKRKQLLKRSQSMVSSNQLLPLKHSFQFNEQQDSFALSLEATVPIFCVAVLATVDVEFLELQGSVAILTVSNTLPGSTARSMATYRCDVE